MSKFEGLYDIRDYQPEDKAFVMSTFLRGLYYGDSWFSLIPKTIFMNNYKKIVESMTQSPKVIIKVACLKEDPTVIIGYSILSSDFQTIHWLFVKQNWRNNGVGKSLVPKYPTAVSHLTKVGKSLMSKFETEVIFNPFAL
jgi:hypothetical protein